MSLDLPEFGSGQTAPALSGFWRAVSALGLIALTGTAILAFVEWRSVSLANASLSTARSEIAQARKGADETRRLLQANSDLLLATASVESAPARVLADIDQLRPHAVSVVGLKIEYLPDGTARLDLSVVARTADAYDLFLSALSASSRFDDIRPGAESRPGLVRAAVVATYRPERKAP